MILSYGLIQNKWFSKLQMKSLRIHSDLFDDYYHDTRTITRENYIMFMKSNSAYHAKPGLAFCQAKTLVIVGGKERPIMKKSAKMIHALIPSSEIITVRNYYHGELSINHADQYVKHMVTLMK